MRWRSSARTGDPLQEHYLFRQPGLGGCPMGADPICTRIFIECLVKGSGNTIGY